jgi:dipeptidyl aminopeptidase/acylaminoacyl peptidase
MKAVNILTVVGVSIAAIAGVVVGLSQGQQRRLKTSSPKQSFAQARQGFQTKLLRQETTPDPAPKPPTKLFRQVKYPSPVGQLSAYISIHPKATKPQPAIIWLSGGFCNCIGEDYWMPAPPSNDQTASAYRQAGIITMYPARRGGNDGVGFKEGFYGEVDDVIAAVDYLAKQPNVDPQRIYLGGHSTGGTLALLVAAAAGPSRFRSVFSFGPVAEVANYGADELPFKGNHKQELLMRAPKKWMHSIQVPTFVIEGTKRGNLDSLEMMERLNKNPQIQFHQIQGADHFNLLAPSNAHIAQAILRDTELERNVSFDPNELTQVFSQFQASAAPKAKSIARDR